ncbi:MAG: hypothetical protein [Microvirus sp.]|nr:MAG: hypothetical protein [Microvirus sp.]
MRKRFKMKSKSSKKYFSKNAGTRKKNLRAVPMRGGFRI